MTEDELKAAEETLDKLGLFNDRNLAAENNAYYAGKNLIAEVRRLRSALTFYADPMNYERTRVPGGWKEPRVDKGRLAQKVLAS